MTAHVVVIGSINLDLSVATDRIPGPGETVLAHDARRGNGGKGANQAVAAAAQNRSKGALFILDAPPSQQLPDDLCREIDLLIVNEHEAAHWASVGASLAVERPRAQDSVPTVAETGSRHASSYGQQAGQ